MQFGWVTGLMYDKYVCILCLYNCIYYYVDRPQMFYSFTDVGKKRVLYML